MTLKIGKVGILREMELLVSLIHGRILKFLRSFFKGIINSMLGSTK